MVGQMKRQGDGLFGSCWDGPAGKNEIRGLRTPAGQDILWAVW